MKFIGPSMQTSNSDTELLRFSENSVQNKVITDNLFVTNSVLFPKIVITGLASDIGSKVICTNGTNQYEATIEQDGYAVIFVYDVGIYNCYINHNGNVRSKSVSIDTVQQSTFNVDLSPSIKIIAPPSTEVNLLHEIGTLEQVTIPSSSSNYYSTYTLAPATTIETVTIFCSINGETSSGGVIVDSFDKDYVCSMFGTIIISFVNPYTGTVTATYTSDTSGNPVVIELDDEDGITSYDNSATVSGVNAVSIPVAKSGIYTLSGAGLNSTTVTVSGLGNFATYNVTMYPAIVL